jgi:hypothetical protein
VHHRVVGAVPNHRAQHRSFKVKIKPSAKNCGNTGTAAIKSKNVPVSNTPVLKIHSEVLKSM